MSSVGIITHSDSIFNIQKLLNITFCDIKLAYKYIMLLCKSKEGSQSPLLVIQDNVLLFHLLA